VRRSPTSALLFLGAATRPVLGWMQRRAISPAMASQSCFRSGPRRRSCGRMSSDWGAAAMVGVAGIGYSLLRSTRRTNGYPFTGGSMTSPAIARTCLHFSRSDGVSHVTKCFLSGAKYITTNPSLFRRSPSRRRAARSGTLTLGIIRSNASFSGANSSQEEKLSGVFLSFLMAAAPAVRAHCGRRAALYRAAPGGRARQYAPRCAGNRWLDHLDGCVVQRRHDPDRRIGEQHANNAAVSQSRQRHDIRVEPGGLDHRSKIVAMVAAAAVSPTFAIAPQEQRGLARPPGRLLLEDRRHRARDRHRAPL